MITFRSVSKTFSPGKGAKLLASVVKSKLSGGKDAGKKFYALRDVSFEVSPGESLAVVGANGAGKSTLLSVVTGLCPPDSGSVEISGTIAALLDLGSGFHPDLTGMENLRLYAAVLGMDAKQTAAAEDEIIQFAELGDFIHQPLRTFSSGMMMRLAFAVAINRDPDILIIDEILAVGDQTFQRKCTERIQRFRDQGKTLLFVSHALPTLMEYCQKALWLDHGRVVEFGDAADVIERYRDSQSGVITLHR